MNRVVVTTKDGRELGAGYDQQELQKIKNSLENQLLHLNQGDKSTTPQFIFLGNNLIVNFEDIQSIFFEKERD